MGSEQADCRFAGNSDHLTFIMRAHMWWSYSQIVRPVGSGEIGHYTECGGRLGHGPRLTRNHSRIVSATNTTEKQPNWSTQETRPDFENDQIILHIRKWAQFRGTLAVHLDGVMLTNVFAASTSLTMKNENKLNTWSALRSGESRGQRSTWLDSWEKASGVFELRRRQGTRDVIRLLTSSRSTQWSARQRSVFHIT